MEFVGGCCSRPPLGPPLVPQCLDRARATRPASDPPNLSRQSSQTHIAARTSHISTLLARVLGHARLAEPQIAPKPRQTSPQPLAGPGTFPQNPPVPPPSDPSRAFPTPGSSQSNQNQSWSLVPHPSKAFLSSTVPHPLLGFDPGLLFQTLSDASKALVSSPERQTPAEPFPASGSSQSSQTHTAARIPPTSPHPFTAPERRSRRPQTPAEPFLRAARPTQLLRLPTSPHSLLGFWDMPD